MAINIEFPCSCHSLTRAVLGIDVVVTIVGTISCVIMFFISDLILDAVLDRWLDPYATWEEQEEFATRSRYVTVPTIFILSCMTVLLIGSLTFWLYIGVKQGSITILRRWVIVQLCIFVLATPMSLYIMARAGSPTSEVALLAGYHIYRGVSIILVEANTATIRIRLANAPPPTDPPAPTPAAPPASTPAAAAATRNETETAERQV